MQVCVPPAVEQLFHVHVTVEPALTVSNTGSYRLFETETLVPLLFC